MTLLLFAITILVLVSVHELGHFAAARAFGVYVREFSVGVGPLLFSRTRRGTKYSLRLLPIGGYVRMAGEDRREIDGSVPADQILYNKPPAVRAAISLAGPLANVFLSLLVTLAVSVSLAMPVLQVADVVPGAPASEALVPGDRVLAVDGRPAYTLDDLTAAIEQSQGRAVTFDVRRGDETLSVAVVPRDEGDGLKVGAYFRASAPTTEVADVSVSSVWYAAGLSRGDRFATVEGTPVATGVALAIALEAALPGAPSLEFGVDRNGERLTLSVPVGGRTADDLLAGLTFGDLGVEVRRPPFADGLRLGLRDFASYATLLFDTLGGIATGAVSARDALQGPVGIASLVRQGWGFGLLVFLQLWALLSLNFGFINLIPFPALDGSRVVFALVEWIRGRPIPPEKEGLIHAIGLFVLLGLLVLITIQDVTRLFG
ncbi:MAG: RIP metalloprotease RseP [Candidatus Bipolaricaulota bacterium]